MAPTRPGRVMRWALALGVTVALGLGAVTSAQAARPGAVPALARGTVAVEAPSSAPSALPAARSGTRVVLKASWHEFRKGESLRLRGTVRSDGERVKGAKVAIRATKKSGKTSTVATVTTNGKGKFVVWLRPAASVRSYTARVSGANSKPMNLERTVGDRTIDDRAQTLGKYLGSSRTGVARLSKAERKELRKPSIASVRYRDYSQGMLVQVVKKSGKTRTWLVRGKILKAYRSAGGPGGKYGVPVGDQQCGLMERGCLQRFTNGTLYEKKSQRKAFGQTGRTKATELLAVARSQLSYRSSRLSSKYNRWTGTVGQPWCSAFQSWVSSAAGHPSWIPKFARLHQLAPYAREHMTTFKNGSKKKIKPGTLAFLDFRNGGRGPEPSHLAMVIKNKRNTIITIEGNASRSAQFTAARGVFIHERAKSNVVFYAYPNW